MTIPMGKGGLPTSPYLFYSCGDYKGKMITMTVTFDGSNNLTGATIFRDPACLYQHILIGIGADGSPDSSSMKFTVPGGTTTVSKAQLNSVGLVTLSDLLSLQVTAGV